MELPEFSMGSLNTESTQETAPESAPVQSEGQPSVQEMIDLDKIEKFRYGGQEWTSKDLQAAILRQNDYTRKTQALSERERSFQSKEKYYQNLSYDLEKIRGNPSLAEEFKKVYPKEFHSYLGQIVASTPQGQGGQPQVPAELMSRLEILERDREEAQTAVMEKHLDTKFSEFGKKYEYSDEERVLAKAHEYLKQGVEVTDDLLEKIFKADHERDKKRIDTLYQKQAGAQKDANKRMRDSGGGGAIPGQAPKSPKNIKEANAELRRHLEGI